MEDKTNVIKIQRYHSPCGDLMLGSFEDKLCLCDWAAESHRDIVDRRLRKVLKAGYEKSTSDVILEAMSQLDEYFNGERTVFEVPLLFVVRSFRRVYGISCWRFHTVRLCHTVSWQNNSICRKLSVLLLPLTGRTLFLFLLRAIVSSAATTLLWDMVAGFLLKAVAGFGIKWQTSVMNEQKTLDYARIAQAIGYIRENFKRQPGLDEIAGEVALSTAHFQRMFTEWAGVSPKKFLQYTSIEYAKRILNETHASLFDAAQETGLSGTGRLYDLFVNIEGMTPGEYKNGGESLSINYSFAKSPFGEIFIASTDKGICCMEFADEHDAAFNSLRKKFPNAKFTSIVDEVQQNALFIFTQDWSKLKEIKLHLKGTDFQLKVWETLLKIPVGGLTTYGDIAVGINNPRACRAVGTAVGENPVAFLIPCHRVIRASGELGNYHWGEIRKTAMIGWEAAKGEVKRGL